MTILAGFCNAVWFAFACLVLATDGLPKEPAYIGGTLLMLLTPLLTLAVLIGGAASAGRLGLLAPSGPAGEAGSGPERASMTAIARAVAIVCNVALLGFVCWALLSQPPHPEEDGYVAFVAVSVFTPIVSVLAILRDRWRDASRRRRPGTGLSTDPRTLDGAASRQGA